MKRHHRIGLLALNLLFAAGARAAPLHLLTTDVPPMAFVKDGKLTGFCVAVVEEMQRRLGDASQIAVLPWARAYTRAQAEPNSVLICPKRTPERESLFHWVGPLLSADTFLYAKAGKAMSLRALDDVKRLPNVLVIRESYAFNYLSSKGFENLYAVNNAEGMLQMLVADRAPAMVLESIQFDAVMADERASHPPIVPVMKLQSLSSYLAFSRDVPDAVVATWQAALDAMKKDGIYRKLYATWFPPSTARRRR